MKRSSLAALASLADMPVVVLKHARYCPNAGRITASRCTCRAIVEVHSPGDLKSILDDERQALRLATN